MDRSRGARPTNRQLRPLPLPPVDGPWAWRGFLNRNGAYEFFQRVAVGAPEPRQLHEPHVAPDGTVLPSGTWVVIYHPIIVDRQRNGDRHALHRRAG
jgi:hypothetical protein